MKFRLIIPLLLLLVAALACSRAAPEPPEQLLEILATSTPAPHRAAHLDAQAAAYLDAAARSPRAQRRSSPAKRGLGNSAGGI